MSPAPDARAHAADELHTEAVIAESLASRFDEHELTVVNTALSQIMHAYRPAEDDESRIVRDFIRILDGALAYRERIDKDDEEAAAATIPVGARVVLIQDAERYPHFIARTGSTGTVTRSDDELTSVRMDEHLPGAEEWDNEVQWLAEVDDLTQDLRILGS